MSTISENSDAQLLDLLRQSGPMSVSQMAQATEVTATAVRQRLARLMSQGLVGRDVARQGRGRPRHCYWLTEKARRQAGSNFADLALVLWHEVQAVQGPDVRRGLLQRLARSMARMYQGQIHGSTTQARMDSLKELLAQRRVTVDVDESGKLPVLTVVGCPYPELAEKDRSICALEKLLFAELIDSPVRLSRCRLDGDTCCQFETN